MTLSETLAALRRDVARWLTGEDCPRKRNVLLSLDHQLALAEHHSAQLLDAYREIDQEESCRRDSLTSGTCATG